MWLSFDQTRFDQLASVLFTCQEIKICITCQHTQLCLTVSSGDVAQVAQRRICGSSNARQVTNKSSMDYKKRKGLLLYHVHMDQLIM